ncbi:MAG: galactose mutarotase [Clostridiales bacterium]|nr:galactose mutarotase [Clostridiales bacterium]
MKRQFYDKINDRAVYLYTIGNGAIEVDICEVGARINALRVNGVDIALGFNCIADYIKSGTYAGATIGRVANRIARGKFSLNGQEYNITRNERLNHLHGGVGFDKKVFDVLSVDNNSIVLQYISEDGEDGYPGRLVLTVKFCIDNNSLSIEFNAISNKDTLWNPTNHIYFNLDGENSGDCRDNLLLINSDKYTPTDNELIPTGEKAEAKGPFDFSSLKRIGTDFDSAELKPTNGYDHNFILNSEHAAHVESKKTGIHMDVFTDMPCLQLYTGGAIKPCAGKSRRYDQWAGFCLEPQCCPNAINMKGFVIPILKTGEQKTRYIKYSFNI